MKTIRHLHLFIALLSGALCVLSSASAEDLYRWSLFYSSRPSKNPDGNLGKSPKLAGIVVDAMGNLYVAEGHSIAKIAPDGTATTFAGSTDSPSGFIDGAGSVARFKNPQALAIDGHGNLYLTDKCNRTIRKITADGVVTTLAGSPGQAGNNDGKGAEARFGNPAAIAVDGDGAVFVGDSNNRSIRKISPQGEVSTFAHAGSAFPGCLAVNAVGDIYCLFPTRRVIQKLTQEGVTLSTFGMEENFKTEDGCTVSAAFTKPCGMSIDSHENLFVVDHDVVLKMEPDGKLTTIGVPSEKIAGCGKLHGVAVSHAGIVYVIAGTAIVAGVPNR